MNGTTMTHKQKLLVILVMLLAILLPLVFWRLIGPLSTDSCDYLSGAQSLAKGQGFRNMSGDAQTLFPPGYSLTISALMMVFRDPILSGRIISLISSIASVLLIFLIASRFFGFKVGIISSFIYTCLPLRITSATVVFSESLSVFLMLLATWLWIKDTDKQSYHIPILSGLVFGFAYLVRPEGLLCACCLYLLSMPVFRLWKNTRLISIVIAFVSLIVVVLPYVWVIHQQTGKWSVTPKYSFNQKAAIVVGQGNGWDPLFRLNDNNTQIAYPAVSERPLQTVKRYVKNIYHAYDTLIIVLGGLLFALPIITMYSCSDFTKQIRLFLPILFAVSILPLVYLPLFFVEPRFVMAIVIPFIILASIFISNVPARLERHNWVNPQLIIIVLSIGIMVLGSLKGVIDVAVAPAAAASSVSIGREMRRIAGPNARIMSSYPVYAYYANAAWQRLPYESLHRTILYARNTKTNFIVLTDRSYQSQDMKNSSVTDLKQMSLVRVIKSYDGNLYIYKVN